MKLVKSTLLLNLVLVSYSNFCLANVNPEALVKSHFKASKVLKDTILLSSKEIKAISKKANARVSKNLYRVLKAVDKNSKILGYGLIDSHIVRSKTQALLFYYDKKNNLQAIELIAFQEPEEYKPKKAYLEKAVHSNPSIPTGATLTYSSIEKAKKRAQVLIEFHTKAEAE